MRGYEDRREQYSQIITAAQWRFHHQRRSQPQITTFISHYPAPTRWRRSPRWPSCHMSPTCVSVLHADAVSPAPLLCKPVNLFLCSSTKNPQKTGRCFVWGHSALLEMCLSICLPHLKQRSREGTCGGGLGALKSTCLTNCGSSVESVAQRAAASSAAGVDTAACGRQRMRHDGRARQKGDLHPRGKHWGVLQSKCVFNVQRLERISLLLWHPALLLWDGLCLFIYPFINYISERRNNFKLLAHVGLFSVFI